ncbi:hypothetical protein [Streptomyces anulatus]|uniref:hypothetical protein n=1 Tax=Streptomyces anulatus TaxID=1892 RepID=UPI00324DB96B|nr:hypothetical protein OH791_17265 [Streptomyces anulatus]
MTTPATVVPLWETDHPYYCTEGNYYRNGNHLTYDSWADFHAEWGELDPDMNLVFRWDWNTPDPTDYCPPDCAGHKDGDCDEAPGPTLQVFWVLQRKAILRSTECAITEADEPAVRAWLTERAAHMRLLWEPLLPAPAV